MKCRHCGHFTGVLYSGLCYCCFFAAQLPPVKTSWESDEEMEKKKREEKEKKAKKGHGGKS